MDALRAIEERIAGTTHRELARRCGLSRNYFWGLLRRQWRATYPAALAIAREIFPDDPAQQGAFILALQSIEPVRPQKQTHGAA